MSPTPEHDDLLTLSQIVEDYHFRPTYVNHLRRLVQTGRLPARKIGKTWVVARSVIEDWLQHRPGPGRPRRAEEDAADPTA